MGAVFLGTPAAAVPSLAALADVADVELVITQPDRASGRRGAVTKSPVKVAAQQFGFTVAQPETRADLLQTLVGGSFRFGLIVAYGRVLTPAMIASTQLGFLNVHFSLLPRWRGAAPVERAIAAGDEQTGVTLMKIDEGLDTGPVLGEIATPIAGNETGGSLTARLSFLGASLVDATVPEYLVGRRRPVPQIDASPTHASPLSKAEAMLAPDFTARVAERHVRAFHPRPMAWLSTPDGPLRVHRAALVGEGWEYGRIVPGPGGPVAGFVDGGLRLTRVQPPGKSAMDGEAWMNGRRGEPQAFGAP